MMTKLENNGHLMAIWWWWSWLDQLNAFRTIILINVKPTPMKWSCSSSHWRDNIQLKKKNTNYSKKNNKNSKNNHNNDNNSKSKYKFYGRIIIDQMIIEYWWMEMDGDIDSIFAYFFKKLKKRTKKERNPNIK